MTELTRHVTNKSPFILTTSVNGPKGLCKISDLNPRKQTNRDTISAHRQYELCHETRRRQILGYFKDLVWVYGHD